MKHLQISRQDKTTWRKIAYTVFVVLISILLSHIPVYGIDTSYISALFGSSSILTFSDMLTGGSLSQLAIGGFGVTSIIMAGIIIQLIGILVPKIEKIHADGESGRRLFDRITFILAMLMTFASGLTVILTESAPYNGVDAWWGHCIPMIEWLIGSAIIVILAQKVHDYGIGNGPTIILAANIAQRIVPDLISYSSLEATSIAIVAAALGVSILIAVYLQGGLIQIKVQQTRKELSMMNADGTIPMPVAISSVLPIVYASSLMMVPSIYSVITGHNGDIVSEILKFTSSTNWYSPTCWENIAGLIIYILMIFMFSFYASKISFSAGEVANRMRERGDVIPGVRPGDDTKNYLHRRRRKLAFIGAFLLCLVAVLPDFILTQVGLSTMSFMGTSLVILMAAFWDLRLRFKGLTKHWNHKYVLFPKTEKKEA